MGHLPGPATGRSGDGVTGGCTTRLEPRVGRSYGHRSANSEARALRARPTLPFRTVAADAASVAVAGSAGARDAAGRVLWRPAEARSLVGEGAPPLVGLLAAARAVGRTRERCAGPRCDRLPHDRRRFLCEPGGRRTLHLEATGVRSIAVGLRRHGRARRCSVTSTTPAPSRQGRRRHLPTPSPPSRSAVDRPRRRQRERGWGHRAIVSVGTAAVVSGRRSARSLPGPTEATACGAVGCGSRVELSAAARLSERTARLLRREGTPRRRRLDQGGDVVKVGEVAAGAGAAALPMLAYLTPAGRLEASSGSLTGRFRQLENGVASMATGSTTSE